MSAGIAGQERREGRFTALSMGIVSQADQERRFAEAELGTLTGLLGSDAQLETGFNTTLAPYTQRYAFNATALTGIANQKGRLQGLGKLKSNLSWLKQEMKDEYKAAGQKGAGKAFKSAFANAGSTGAFLTARANRYMDEAQAAAEAGDFEAADALIQQSRDFIANLSGLKGIGSMALQESMTLTEDPLGSAQSKLSSPMGMTVGQIVREGQEILDPESETSQRLMSSMTEGAERSIAAGSREAMASSRDMGMARGAAQSPYAAQALNARTLDAAATAKADVYTKAAAVYESMRTAVATNAVEFATNWAQNTSGIRETYQSARDTLALAMAGFSNSAADRQLGFAQLDAAAHQASLDRRAEMQGAVIGAIGSLAGYAVGGVLGGGIGGAGVGGASNQISSATGGQTGTGPQGPSAAY